MKNKDKTYTYIAHPKKTKPETLDPFINLSDEDKMLNMKERFENLKKSGEYHMNTTLSKPQVKIILKLINTHIRNHYPS